MSQYQPIPVSCFWITGLPAAGKTILGVALRQQLQVLGRPACLLNGGELCCGLCADLGLYTQARTCHIVGMTGWDAPYEPPLAPEFAWDTTHLPVDVMVGRILSQMLPWFRATDRCQLSQQDECPS